MDLDIELEISDLWCETSFQQDEWGYLNFFIGPNGTGKSIFAEELKDQIRDYEVRYLSSERLSGMERRRYGQFSRTNLRGGWSIDNEDTYRTQARNYGLSSDAYIELRDKPDLRARVQGILSEFFDREIRLVVEGGSLQPEMRDIEHSVNYDLRKDESHGLKELISILTLIHDNEYDIIIIDEPELHLHPQYQRFLLKEIQKLSGNPVNGSSRAFFLITHSPSFLEFNNLEDLTNIYSFRTKNRPPFFIDEFSDEDAYRISRLLPRLNTRHKEVLFSRKPILVEGYTDQQIFSITLENHDRLSTDPESTIIGIGGKEELDSFFRFCINLGLKPRIIADLDMLFQGTLRETLSQLPEVRELAQEEGLDSTISNAMGEAESRLNSFIELIDEDDILSQVGNSVEGLNGILDDVEEAYKRRYLLYRALLLYEQDLYSEFGEDEIRFVKGRVENIIEILSNCGYHVLNLGELEDYLREDDSIRPVGRDQKSRLFNETREGLLDADSDERIEDIVGELLPILQDIFISQEVPIIQYLEEPISEWVHEVQWATRRGEVESIEDLREHNQIGTSRYERIFEIETFEINNEDFTCRIRLHQELDPEERTYEFGLEDSAANIHLQ